MLEEWGRGEWIKFTVCAVLGAQIFIYLLKPWILKLGTSTKLPPGDLAWPFWDETMEYLKSAADSRSPGKWIEERRARYGNVFKARLFGTPTVFALGSKANRWVFTNDLVLFRQSWPQSMRQLCGPSSVIVVHGDQHRRIRQYLEQFLGTEAVKRFTSTMEAGVLNCLERWQNQDLVEAFPEIHDLTFRISFELLMGGAQGVDLHKMHQDFQTVGRSLICLPINLPWTQFGKAIKTRDAIHKFMYSEIQKRRAEWNAGLSPLGQGGRLSSKNMELARDLLDLFMFWELHPDSSSTKQWEFTDTEIVENMVVIVEASHGTTTSTLTSAIFFLASRPQIIQELRKECVSVAGTKRPGEGLSWADTKNLPYMRKVILETLRFRTTVPQINKQTLQDVEFEGYKIPKGWVLTVCQRQTHNKEENFPSPEMFEPSRFDQNPDLYSYIPFGRGPRMCPGDKFAMTLMQIFLYHFIMKFDWELVNPNEEFVMFFSPRPKQGLPIKLKPRKATI